MCEHIHVCVCVCVCVYIYIYKERERYKRTDRQRKKKKKDRQTDRKMGKGDFFNGVTHHFTVGPVSRDGMQPTDCHLQCFDAHALYCSILGLY